MTAVALAAGRASRPVTDWPARLALTAATLAIVVALALLMLRGWRNRAARQAHLPEPPAIPADTGDPLLGGPVEGVFIGTTMAGDWLDRVVVHDLGVRSRAHLDVAGAGVAIRRQGARDLFVPAQAVRDVRLDKGMAGKVVAEGGLVVLSWQLGGHTVDTGFAPRYADDRDRVVSAVRSLLAEAA